MMLAAFITGSVVTGIACWILSLFDPHDCQCGHSFEDHQDYYGCATRCSHGGFTTYPCTCLLYSQPKIRRDGADE